MQWHRNSPVVSTISGQMIDQNISAKMFRKSKYTLNVKVAAAVTVFAGYFILNFNCA